MMMKETKNTNEYTASPKVSLIMKVYNGEKYLREAIDSVLAQTFEDFEFLIMDDASSDSSVEIVESYTDRRIRIIKNEKNLGIVAGQNLLISEAKGEYIAVMDCDDISYPTRLEKQVEFLDKHPDYILCGSYRNEIKDGKVEESTKVRRLKPETLRFALYFINPITHSSLMFRSSMYKEDGIQYGPEKVAEDYGAIVDMAKNHPIALIPERLVAYRFVGGSVSNTCGDALYEASRNIRLRMLQSVEDGLVKGRSKKPSKESLIILEKFYKREMQVGDTKSLFEAIRELADYEGADIEPHANAYYIVADVMTEYILTVKSYNMTMWKILRDSDVKHLTSIKTDLGRKLLVACLLHIRRRG
ncbi:MAG: glycosyltransferase [Eubacterium sp.]|nr:glycosyltransferase [Eubacterium sp.]